MESGTDQVKVRLPEAMATSLITLYGKALDARMTPSILHDEMAVRAVERIDYDFGGSSMNRRYAPNVAVRAKHFDDWTRDFLARHERATVLHLGAGLDPRVWRIDPGPGVVWYDVDQDGVINARRQIFPERENYHLIASSVTEPGLLDEIPADRPALVVAEGLTMYLTPAEGHKLLSRIVDHFASGEITFDTHNRLAVKMMNKQLAKQFGGGPLLHWAIDRAELSTLDPRLHRVDALPALETPAAKALNAGQRIFATLSHPFPALRDIGMDVRLTFGQPAGQG